MARPVTDPIAWEAANWPWQVFLTLTWSNRLIGASTIRKEKIIYAYLRYISKRLPVLGKSGQILSNRKSFPALEFLGGGEDGEITQRNHYHLLLANFHPDCLNISTMFFIKNSWETITGDSNARAWRYDSSLPGVEYVLKSFSDFSKNEALTYELGKFSGMRGDSELMLAHALYQKWVLRRRNQRSQGTLTATVRGSRGKNRHGNKRGNGLISQYSLSSSSRGPK